MKIAYSSRRVAVVLFGAMAFGAVGGTLPLAKNSDGSWTFGDARLSVVLDGQSGLASAYMRGAQHLLVADPGLGCPVAFNCNGPAGAGKNALTAKVENVTRRDDTTVCAAFRTGDWRCRLFTRLLPEKMMVRQWLEFAWSGAARTEFNGIWLSWGKVVCGPGCGEYFMPGEFPPARYARRGFRPDVARWGMGNFTCAVADDGAGRSYLACLGDMEPYSDQGNVCVVERKDGFSLAMRFLSSGYANPGVWQCVGDGWLRFGNGTAESELETMHDWHRTAGYLPPADRPDRVRDLVVYSTHPKGRSESGRGDVGGFNYASTYLPYLAALGVNCIWMRPVVHKDTYHPDRIYEQMEGVGSEADHLAYVRRAHALGMEVWSDAVPHGGSVTNQRTKEHPEWVCWKRDGSFQDAYWAYDFNWPTWVSYYSDWVEWYTRKFELDGWRMDVPTGSRFPNWNPAIPYARASYAKRQGGIAQQTAIRAAARRVNPNAVTLGEENPSCWSKVADAIYDQMLCHSHFHALRERDPKTVVADLRRWLHEQKLAYVPGTIWMRYPESHDSRLADSLWGRPCANALMALCAWIDGFPLVCNEGEDGTFEVWRRIFAVRKALPELRRGDVDYVSANAPDGVFVCVRRLAGLESAVIVNFNPNRVAGVVSASGKGIEIDLPPFGYEVRRLMGPSVESALGELRPYVPEKKGPVSLRVAPGGVALDYGAVAEIRDLTNGFVSAAYVLKAEKTSDGLKLHVDDLAGLDPQQVRLVVRFAGTERWFAHAAEGSFGNPYFVRHPGQLKKAHCATRINGGRYVDTEVCWSSRSHPLGLSRSNAEVGSVAGAVAVAVGGFAQGVQVDLRDRLCLEEGLALTVMGTSRADFTCLIRELSPKEACAARAADVGDSRIRLSAGGWTYDDGSLRVRFANSGAIVGAWRKNALGAWQCELGRCGWRGTTKTNHVPTLGWRLHDEDVSEQDYDCYGRTVFRRDGDGTLRIEFSEVLPALFGRRYLMQPAEELAAYSFADGKMSARVSFRQRPGWIMSNSFGEWEYRMIAGECFRFEPSGVLQLGTLPKRVQSKGSVHSWIYHDSKTGDFKVQGREWPVLIWSL